MWPRHNESSYGYHDLKERDAQMAELTTRMFLAKTRGQKHEVRNMERKIRRLGQGSGTIAA